VSVTFFFCQVFFWSHAFFIHPHALLFLYLSMMLVVLGRMKVIMSSPLLAFFLIVL
jgi:hypothetical protein